MDKLLGKRAWQEDLQHNPWDQGGLAVICLFIATILSLTLFAVTFGLLPAPDSANKCEET